MQTPNHKVVGTSVISEDLPRAKVTLPKSFKYVGADRWNLFDVADCEIQVFVEADNQKRVKSYCWVQFEAYLPSKPTYSYEYKNGTDIKIAGLDFNMRPRFGPMETTFKPGSEIERVVRLISAAGYTMPKEIINVRLVHLPEPTKRRELMILYAEDMAPTGVTFAELIVDNKLSPKWAPVEAALVKRVLQRVKIQKL
ncbi:MAG: hypothetical protein WCK51_06755 [Armatimonadota bacterium]